MTQIRAYGHTFTCTCGDPLGCQYHGGADPDSGYRSSHTTARDYGPDVRCKRCGGRALWAPVTENADVDDMERALCLRCADEWARATGVLFPKHGWKDARNGDQKWHGAFQEFVESEIGTFARCPDTWGWVVGKKGDCRRDDCGYVQHCRLNKAQEARQ